MTSKQLSKLSPKERAEHEDERYKLMLRDYQTNPRCRPYIEAQTRLVMAALRVARENYPTNDEFVRIVRPILDQYAREIIRAVAWGKRSSGGGVTARERKIDAAKRMAKIEQVAAQIRKTEPGIKGEALAAMLAERGLGGKEALRKKLARGKR